MAMKFNIEQKGQMFLVVNASTGQVRGRFKDKGEAEAHRDRVQKNHNEGIEQVTSRTSVTNDGTEE